MIKTIHYILLATLLLPGCNEPLNTAENDHQLKCPVRAAKDVQFASGTLITGKSAVYPEEQGHSETNIAAFSIQNTEVTNAQFSKFVEDTGYITLAEKGLNNEIAPGMPEEFYQPGSMVFTPFVLSEYSGETSWWIFVPGANWRHPYGPDSNIDGKEQHPVVHITLQDAETYAKWAGRRLPTEAEWEYAATNGGKSNYITSKKAPEQANVWHGLFPFHEKTTDGFLGTSPVGCYQATQAGLYDMLGNVWELTSSVYYPTRISTQFTTNYPEGYSQGFEGIPVLVIKGGSHLCSETFCARYRPQARQPQDKYLGTSHVGFRTVAL